MPKIKTNKSAAKRFRVTGNGKIKRNVDYWSLGDYLMQVGLMPAPAAATT